MTEEEITWIARVAMRYQAIVFLWVGKYGTHVMLLPGKVWGDRKPLAME